MTLAFVLGSMADIVRGGWSGDSAPILEAESFEPPLSLNVFERDSGLTVRRKHGFGILQKGNLMFKNSNLGTTTSMIA